MPRQGLSDRWRFNGSIWSSLGGLARLHWGRGPASISARFRDEGSKLHLDLAPRWPPGITRAAPMKLRYALGCYLRLGALLTLRPRPVPRSTRSVPIPADGPGPHLILAKAAGTVAVQDGTTRGDSTR